LGIAGLPAGQAQDSFPTVSFSGNGLGINRWAGYSSNRNTSNGTILGDNLQWQKGKHSLTIGGQVAWMQYNWLNNATGVNPLQLTFSSNETAGYVAGKTSQDTISGNSYASYLLGAVNAGTFTVSSAPETGARYRAISPYIQDNWRVTSKLTLNLGLRWDYYPTYLEAQDRLSWMDPQKMNTLVNYPGALSFAGSGNTQCNCRTNAKNYFKNFGPRLGFAYAASSRTVVRGSWGVMYTHGNDVSGSATSRQGSGLLGYAASPKRSKF
jgi:outer membrane receptor protein involved in Fe transport